MTSDDGPIRVLLVDDDEDDYVLTRDLLLEIPEARFDLEWVSDPEEALDAMCRAEHDLFLLDYSLGRINGLDLIREASRRNCKVPMILLTGLGERKLDYAAMTAGASDYLEKGRLDAALLERAIRYTLQQQRHADELERKVLERTQELAQANTALQIEIAERRRVEEALLEADRRKNEFLATLAHELRNPLAPIRNALEITRLAAGTPELVEQSRGIIERQVKQLVRLVDDLLDISRISRGKIQLHREMITLSAVVESAVEGSLPAIQGASHALEVDLPPSPVELFADPTRLSQVLLNLLNNAAKYTEPGGRIQLSAHVDGDEVVFLVRDNGAGLEPEAIPLIFDLFTQVHSGIEQSQGGLGIGLSLVKRLVELHGGRIEARSDGLGQGSEFEVRLPRLAEPGQVDPDGTVF